MQPSAARRQPLPAHQVVSHSFYHGIVLLVLLGPLTKCLSRVAPAGQTVVCAFLPDTPAMHSDISLQPAVMLSQALCRRAFACCLASGRHTRLTGLQYCCGMAAAEQETPTDGKGFDVAKDGWYTELGPMWPGQGLSLKVKEVLYKARSDFQDVCVFESESFGTVLLLDGVIQCTDRDEFSYQEMIAHLPLCALEEPARKVLVVGGGDGGVLRELTRYPSLQEIHIAEIDGAVPEVSKRFLPAMAVGFADPRVKLHITDGIEFVRQAAEGSYDAIIVDSSDPVGPAEVLFEKPFFEAMHRAVRPGGIVCTQAESLWLHLDIIKALACMCSEVFEGGSVSYAVTTIPTYPSGQIGMMVCAKASSSEQPPLDVRVPRQPAPGPNEQLNVPKLRYYNAALHRASFVLPQFAQDALGSSLTAAPEAL